MKNLLLKPIIISAITLTMLLPAEGFSKDNSNQESIDSAGITQRVIKIQGTVDKPRTIFIVPRARLVNNEKGSIEKYALPPVFPDSSIASHVK